MPVVQVRRSTNYTLPGAYADITFDLTDVETNSSISNDFPNKKVDPGKLQAEIYESDITIALDYISTGADNCYIWFKDELSSIDSTATLPAIISAHDGEPLIIEAPITEDGRPIVRADTRPLNFETYFTMAGDSTAIGSGEVLKWDFSNNDNYYSGPDVLSDYKCKRIDLTFVCPIYIKDGAVYFFDTPWGCYVNLDIIVPTGSYYPNPAGSIPAIALGLSGTDMYAYATTDIIYQRYVNKHYICGDCPMGDELNAEGCAINPIPVGWKLRGSIYTPTSDNTSKGYASFEVYRCHTKLLPGQTIESLH